MDDFGASDLVDEHEVAALEAAREAKRKEKEERVKTGVDDRVLAGAAAAAASPTDADGEGDGFSAAAVAALTLEQREARWGFTLDELRAATKVVTVLFNNPHLYVGDPYLAESRLYTMVSRDRKTKRENKEAFKKIQNEEKNRRDRAKRELDVATIKKTLMKKERDAALQALLLPPPPGDEVLLIGGDKPETGAPPLALAAAVATPAPEISAAPKTLLTDFATSIKILKFLECEFEKGGYLYSPAPERSATSATTPQLEDVNWNRIGIATAKFYRIHPHPFGTSMPPPILAEDVVMRKLRDLIVASSGAEQDDAKKLRCSVGGILSHFRRDLTTPAEQRGGQTLKELLPRHAAARDATADFSCSLPCELATLDAVRKAGDVETYKKYFISIIEVIFPQRSGELFHVERLTRGFFAEVAPAFDRLRTAFVGPSGGFGGAGGSVDGERASGDLFVRDDAEVQAALRGVEDVFTRHLADEPAKLEMPTFSRASLHKMTLAISALCDLFLIAVLPADEPLTTTTTKADIAFLRDGRPESNELFNATSTAGGGGVADDDPPIHGAKSKRKKVVAAEAEEAADEDVPVTSYDLFDEEDTFRVEVFGLLRRGGALLTANNAEAAAAAAAAAVADESGAFQMHRTQKCHTCKNKYRELHGFYYSLCPPCGEYNYDKRMLTRDLRNKVVLLTGCRIKIGYAMALSLLRCGATLIGTTRFAHDAVARFMQEPDFAEWKGRLHLYSLDLRDMWMVTQFCGFIAQTFPKVFAIINNAAQTIARTPEYTADLRRQEAAPAPVLIQELRKQGGGKSEEWWNFFLHNSSVTIGESLRLEHHPAEHARPFDHVSSSSTTPLLHDVPATEQQHSQQAGIVGESRIVSTLRPASQGFVYDRYDTQAEESDRRSTNSWTMNMGEVQGSEAAEVMAINALSPFVLNSRLKPQLLNRAGDLHKNEKRFIINVSAMEGQFYRFKQTTHPHTNMAKAALNMMTRTAAADYARDGIYMNSVDTGWITDESPMEKKQRRNEEFMLCPLDEVDAAARCLDLIYTDSVENGKFYKDFHTIAW